MGHKGSICFVAMNPGLVGQLTQGSGGYLGGIELQVSLLGRELAARGWKVSYIVADEGQDDAVEADEMTLIKGSSRREGLLSRTPWQPRMALQRAFARAAADIYVLQGAGWRAKAAADYCRHTGARFVFWVASNTDPMCRVSGKSRIPWWQRGAAFRGIQMADRIIAQTHYQILLVHKYLGKTAVLVPNMWPYEVRMRLLPEAPTVLWVANMRPVKRPEMALEIAAALPEWRFVMVGGAVRKHERYYDQIMQQAKAIPNLTCTGFLPFVEADRLFEQATVFLNTSAVEGFPNTYLQAWSRGVPVVGSFDPDEAICRHGLGVHFKTVDEAVKALRALCGTESGVLQAIGARATKYIQENHSTDVVIGQLEALLESS